MCVQGYVINFSLDIFRLTRRVHFLFADLYSFLPVVLFCSYIVSNPCIVFISIGDYIAIFLLIGAVCHNGMTMALVKCACVDVRMRAWMCCTHTYAMHACLLHIQCSIRTYVCTYIHTYVHVVHRSWGLMVGLWSSARSVRKQCDCLRADTFRKALLAFTMLPLVVSDWLVAASGFGNRGVKEWVWQTYVSLVWFQQMLMLCMGYVHWDREGDSGDVL